MALFSPHSLPLHPSFLRIAPKFFPKSDHFSSVLPTLTSKTLKNPHNFPPTTTIKTLLSSSQSFAISETEEDEFDDIQDIENLEDFDFEGLIDEDEDELDPFADSPWEGAVMYQRNSAATHVEYATTLERLGLEGLSSETSQQRAAAMGIRLPPPLRSSRRKQEEEREEDTEEMVTPVLVSVDVTRKRGRIRLDGIVRTVMTLPCYQ